MTLRPLVPAALVALLAVAGTPAAHSLLGGPDRPAARATPALDLPPPSPAVALAWPEGAAELDASCSGHCAVALPAGAAGDAWVAWDGARSRPFAAALEERGEGDGGALRPGARGLDAVRVAGARPGAVLHVWGDGPFTASVAPAADGVPNLVALVPTHLGRPPGGAGQRGCLPEESAAGAGRCLRFSTGVANPGPAPLELSAPDGGAAGLAGLVQALAGGDRAAGLALYHAGHGHFHFDGFMRFALHPVDPEAGLRLPAVAAQGKTGFCMVDWGLLAEAEDPPAKTFWRRGCEPGAGPLRMGVQPGWYDLYRWFLPEQALDVSGLPDGTYELVVEVDPAGLVEQAQRLDDRASLVFAWQGGKATALEGRGFYAL